MADEQRERMSEFEALMWELERSPMLSNAMGNLTMLDRPPDRARLTARLRNAVDRVPRLRQWAVPAPGRLNTPEWVADPAFDLDHHLRWMSLGGSGTTEELHDLVAMLSGQPFDRGRPLWEFIVIEGLEGGRAAMLQRLHHTITDGEGGIRLSVEFLDLERAPGDDLADEGTPSAAQTRTSGGAAATHHAGDVDVDVDAGGVAGMARDLGDTLRHRGGQLASAFGNVGGLVTNPGDAVEVARSAARQALGTGRSSPLWIERSLQRWFGTTELDLAATKEAAHGLGGSVNDFFVTGAVAAAGAYHRRHGVEVEELSVSMPISIRPSRRGAAQPGDADAGEAKGAAAQGNAFTPSQSAVPAGEMEPAERFAAVHEVLAATRAERALGVVGSAAAVMNLLPSAAVVAAGERVTGGVDFVCSNVRAAPFDLYLGGALIEANYPIGPLAGTAFNLTTMSYRGVLFLGLVVDPVAVEEPGSLLADLEQAYRELFAAA